MLIIFCEPLCHTKQALSSFFNYINVPSSIIKLHFGRSRRFGMDFCHLHCPRLNSFEHMQKVCYSFSGSFDGTVNWTKTAVDGKQVTDWIGSTTDAEGHSTRTTHYFKLLPSRRNYGVCQDGALSLTSHLSVSSQRSSFFSWC